MIALLFVPETSAQFLPHEACKFVDGQHNTGIVNHTLRDPVNPKTSFYTVSREAVCKVTGAYATSGDPEHIKNHLGFEKVITPDEVGVSIRDIAVDKHGGMAVITSGRRVEAPFRAVWEYHNSRLDRTIWHRSDPSTPFYEIVEIAEADMGRIEDVWLNGDGTTLVAVSATKVGTWERVGNSWSNVNLTVLADIGVGYFPTVSELTREEYRNCRSEIRHVLPGRTGIRIMGHPDGKKVFIDALHVVSVKPFKDWECPLLIGDPGSRNSTTFGFVIEAEVGTWQWHKPVFVTEKWCLITQRRISDPSSAWSIAISYSDPDIVWAMCWQDRHVRFARMDGDGWAKVHRRGRDDFQRVFNDEIDPQVFLVHPDDPSTLLWTEDISRGHVWEYRGGELHENDIQHWDHGNGGVGALGTSGSDKVGLSYVQGTLVYFDWSVTADGGGRVWVGAWGRGVKHSIRNRDRGEVVHVCMTPDRDLLAMTVRRRQQHLGNFPSIRSYDHLELWRSTGSTYKKVGETPLDWYAWDYRVLCAPAPYTESIIVHTYRFDSIVTVHRRTMEVRIGDDADREEYRRVFERHEEISPRRCSDRMVIGECFGHAHLAGHGTAFMTESGIEWWDTGLDGLGGLWREDQRSDVLVDEGEWDGIGMCGDVGSPAILMWRRGMTPKCVDVDVPAPVAREEATIYDVTSILYNYPNPFTHNTTLSFGCTQSGDGVLEIYAIDGRLVSRIDMGFVSAGSHLLSYKGRGLAPGIYMARITVDGVPVADTHRMVRI